ncbi:MAG: SUMF1/EgtB/PvdO family nonheme iron enzyme [Polyangiaceae bacterium]
MRRFFSALAALPIACAAAPPPEAEPTPPPTPPTSPPLAPASATVPDAGAAPQPTAVTPEADAAATPEADAGAEAGACPSGMVLVQGDYCTKVDQKCSKSWYAEWNKKKVCEDFEPKSSCVGSRIKKRFCIDKYSWPNKAGERPEVMNNFYQAQVKCAAVGKRMCTESEWTFACEGPDMKPFPYGYKRDSTKCNGDHPWDGPDMPKVAQRDPKELARLWKGVRSGNQPECISDFGVHDLPGNNDEVVANEQRTSDWKGKYDSVHTGGPWYEGVRNQCRPKIYTHDEGFYYYFLGFRCCSEPDGKTTDPRTPHQREKKWEFSRIERLANTSISEVKDALDRKAKGTCTCSPRDVKCKTLCGTLLGPGATDTDLKKLREQRAKAPPPTHK